MKTLYSKCLPYSNILLANNEECTMLNEFNIHIGTEVFETNYILLFAFCALRLFIYLFI